MKNILQQNNEKKNNLHFKNKRIKIFRRFFKMKVGCVKEIKNNEFRVGMTPDNVKSYVNAGHDVYIEKGAGEGSGFLDAEYVAAGAKMIDTAKEVWDTVEMMIKVKEPLPEEYPLFHEGLILYTYLHLAADKPQTDALLGAKVKGVAYETLIERNGSIPLLAPMSQIAGRLSIQEGAKYLEKRFGGEGVLLAGVPGTPKANIVILGGGSVGTNACKIAVGMGANVTIMDINLQRLAYLDDIFGARIQTLVSNDANIEKAVKEAQKKILAKNQTMAAHVGCPGSKSMQIQRKETSETKKLSSNADQVSKLQNWPVQIKLAPVSAPYFNDAKLLIAADCTAYAYASFHQDFIQNKVTLIGCPKLDQVDYSEKLTAIIQNNNIQSVTIVRMEVPCCGGLEMAAKKALQNSGKFIPWQVVTISIDGKIIE